MNRIFIALVAIAFFFAAWGQLHWTPPTVPEATLEQSGPAADDPTLERLVAVERQLEALSQPPPAEPPAPPMKALTTGIIESSKGAAELAISLIGVMAFFLGLMKVAEAGGMLTIIARLLQPVMVRLFPEVPANHPAMGAMILNFSANALGLGNAATPFGIKAMQELDKLNPNPGTATNAMVLFLAINTSSITLLPTGVMGIRGVLGSSDPGGIMGTTLFATLLSTATAIGAAWLYQRFVPANEGPIPTPESVSGEDAVPTSYPAWISGAVLLGIVGIVPVLLMYGSVVSDWVIPFLAIGLLGFGFFRGVPVYERFVEGAKDGFEVAVKIIPYLVAILVAVGMLRSSGALGTFVSWVSPLTAPLGLPAEALPMALLRPLSGSGAYGVMMDILQTEGPDSYVGYLVSTLQGSTETTFYVIAVYFGAIRVTRVRHALAAALTADVMGVIAAVMAVQIYLSMLGS
jgi:spore maturation protein SpmA